MNDEPPQSPVGDASSDGAAFVEVASVYDHLMRDVPYGIWIDYVGKLLERRGAKPRTILDLACGTGNVTERLVDAGFEVTGVDIAAPMIELARAKAAANGRKIDYFVQDAADLDLPGKSFDLCVSLFDSLNYVLDPERLASAFVRVHKHLVPGGLFIFDLNSLFALENRFFDQDNLGAKDALTYNWESEFFPETRLCHVKMRFWRRVGDGAKRFFEEQHWQRAHTVTEVRDMLANAGFVDVETLHAYSFRAPTPTSDRIFYVSTART